MKRHLLFLSVLFLLGSGTAGAGTITNTYTDQSIFQSALWPGYYLQPFSTHTTGTSLSYSGSGYAYTLKANGTLNLLQTSYNWLQETMGGDTITLTFTGGTVTALGADFFGVNFLAQPKPTTITLSFAGGPTRTISTTTSTSTFTGYTFDAPLTSMTISSPSGYAAALDNLIVGRAVPEPGTVMLSAAALGLLGLAKLIPRRG